MFPNESIKNLNNQHPYPDFLSNEYGSPFRPVLPGTPSAQARAILHGSFGEKIWLRRRIPAQLPGLHLRHQMVPRILARATKRDKQHFCRLQKVLEKTRTDRHGAPDPAGQFQHRAQDPNYNPQHNSSCPISTGMASSEICSRHNENNRGGSARPLWGPKPLAFKNPIPDRPILHKLPALRLLGRIPDPKIGRPKFCFRFWELWAKDFVRRAKCCCPPWPRHVLYKPDKRRRLDYKVGELEKVDQWRNRQYYHARARASTRGCQNR